jgi:hypothetical protein
MASVKKRALYTEINNFFVILDKDCSKRWAFIRDYYIRKQGKPGAESAGEAAKKDQNLLSFLDSCPNGKRR